jgi:hypothetical protein
MSDTKLTVFPTGVEVLCDESNLVKSVLIVQWHDVLRDDHSFYFGRPR